MNLREVVKSVLEKENIYLIRYPAFYYHKNLEFNFDSVRFVVVDGFEKTVRGLGDQFKGSARILKRKNKWIFDFKNFRLKFVPAVLKSPKFLKMPEFDNFTPILKTLFLEGITINAMAVDGNGNFIDPLQGSADFEKGIIKQILPGSDFFFYNPYWMLKIGETSAELDFVVDSELVKNVYPVSMQLINLKPSLIRKSFEAILLAAQSDRPFSYLYDSGIMEIVLPEVSKLKGFDKTTKTHHKDLWDHTIRVILKIDSTPVLKWVALLHDIGKTATRRVEGQNISFYRHEDISAYLFTGIAKRLEFDEEMASKIHFLIKKHSRINHYNGEWTDSAIRRLMRDIGDHLSDLMKFSRADITTKNRFKLEKLRGLSLELEKRIAEVKEKDSMPPLLPSGIGFEIMKTFDLKPGPEIGKIKKLLEEEVEKGNLPRNDKFEIYIEYLKKRGVYEILKTNAKRTA